MFLFIQILQNIDFRFRLLLFENRFNWLSLGGFIKGPVKQVTTCFQVSSDVYLEYFYKLS